MPKQPTTVALQAPPEWAISLTEKVSEGFKTLRADLSLVANDLDVLKGRVGNLEESRRADESRAAIHSIKVKSITDSDATQDAELSKERVAREELAARVGTIETKVDAIHTAVVGAINNPKVRFVGKVLFAAAVTYSGLHGLKVLP